jgi:hypothetical protein
MEIIRGNQLTCKASPRVSNRHLVRPGPYEHCVRLFFLQQSNQFPFSRPAPNLSRAPTTPTTPTEKIFNRHFQFPKQKISPVVARTSDNDDARDKRNKEGTFLIFRFPWLILLALIGDSIPQDPRIL